MKFIISLLLMFIFFTTTQVSGQATGSTKNDTLATQYKSLLGSDLNFSLNANIDPGSPLSLTPVVSLNLEHFTAALRYNYEDIKTFSTMVGYRFIHDEKFWYEIVPSIAVSAGNYNSISPGILAAGGLGRVAFIGDIEYSFSVDADDVNFFYTRLEFLADIANGFYGGINFQRTQIFETENFLDAGVQAGVYFGAFDLYAEADNFWNSDRYFIIGISYFLELHNKSSNTSTVKQRAK